MPQRPELSQEDRQLIHQLLNNECTYRMPAEVIDEFISKGELMALRRGRTVIAAGEVDDNLYLILDGIMRCWYRNGRQEVTLSFGLPGTIVQPMHCYYGGEPSSENYAACCPTRLLKIARSDFDSLVERNHCFAQWNLRLAQCQLYHYEIRRREIKGDAQERYAALVRHRPEIIRNVSLRIIATYLGITPEYLSALRAKI